MTHLDDVKQTYFEHMKDAFFYSFTSFTASIIFMIHGIFPELLIFEGSNKIFSLNQILIEKKKKLNINLSKQ
jgi:hypothetical protein